MRPVEFDGQNQVLRAPPEAGELVDSLPVLFFKNRAGVPHVVSCWSVSEDEKRDIMRTGLVYLTILTDGRISPMSISSHRPFDIVEDGDPRLDP